MSKRDEIPDESLDAMILAAYEAQSKERAEPDDEEILRYVSGELDRTRSKEIEAALLESSTLRRRVADAARLVEQVQDPKTSRRFEESAVRRPGFSLDTSSGRESNRDRDE